MINTLMITTNPETIDVEHADHLIYALSKSFTKYCSTGEDITDLCTYCDKLLENMRENHPFGLEQYQKDFAHKLALHQES